MAKARARTPKERMYSLIKYSQTSAKYINRIISGNGTERPVCEIRAGIRTIDNEFISRTLAQYPYLRREWLAEGRGNMLNDEFQKEFGSVTSSKFWLYIRNGDNYRNYFFECAEYYADRYERWENEYLISIGKRPIRNPKGLESPNYEPESENPFFRRSDMAEPEEYPD